MVKEVELGPFKHRVDTGLSLRNAAYSFIETSIETLIDLHLVTSKFFNEGVLQHGIG